MAQHLRRQAEESFVLQSKIAQRKAQLLRQSAEFASRTLRPTYWPQALTGRRSSRTPSPIMEQQVSNRELIDQLKQMNAQQIVQLATVSHLVSPAQLTAAPQLRCPVNLRPNHLRTGFRRWTCTRARLAAHRRLSWPSFVCMRERIPFLTRNASANH